MNRHLAADKLEFLARKIHSRKLKDPRQNIDFKTSTTMEQLWRAIHTIETEMAWPDGSILTADDVAEVGSALGIIKTVVDRIGTKLAANQAQHREPPRSK